jgi:type II secretory pathway component GspD/PulD (secretin)
MAGLCLQGGNNSDSPKEEALALAKKARRAEKAGHNAEAYVLYSEASALQQQNVTYQAKVAALQARAAAEGAKTPPAAPAPDAEHREIPEDKLFDSLTAREVAQARQLRGPAELKAKTGVQNFDFNGTARSLFDRVAQSFGLETIYDSDYPTAGNAIRFQVTDADYRTALHDLEAATSSFVVPLSPKLFMIAEDTPQKRSDLEQTIAVSIPVPQALTTAELTEIVNGVKQVTNVEKMAFDSVDDTVIFRDRVSRVLPAEALLQELFSLRSDVMIDVEFLEITDSDMVNYGFSLTNSFQVVFLGHILNNIVSFPAGANALYSFGGGKTLFGLTTAEAQALFNQTISSNRTLLRTQLRASQGQAATFHSGEKYPVITAQYAGTVPSTQQGQVYAPPVQFTYEDLGFSLKVTPHIHFMGEVTLTVDSSFQVLTGQSVNSVPVIGRRQLTSEVRLKDGEWVVVAGMMSPSSSRSVSGFRGLANIPLLGNLFRQVSTDKENENLLIAIRPRLLSLPPDQIVTHRLRVGTETRPFSPL